MSHKTHKTHKAFIVAVHRRQLGKVTKMLKKNPGLVKARVGGMGPLQTLMLTRGFNFYTKRIARAIIRWMAEEDRADMKATIEHNRRCQWTSDSHEVIAAELAH